VSDPIIVETKGSIGIITLNRPEVMNAFSLPMADQLGEALTKFANDTTIRLVFIRGNGRAFSAGGDIKLMSETKDLPQFFDQISRKVHDAVLAIRQMPQPVVAVCNGPVSGVAFGLIVACDLRIASSEATFHAGTTSLGLAPNGSLTYFLPRLIGRGRATRMILTAEKIAAETAFKWGLVDEVSSSEQLENTIAEWENKLSQKAPLAHKKLKELFFAADNDLPAHLDRERKAISESAGTKDFKEGITAFLEKRKPNFKGQ